MKRAHAILVVIMKPSATLGDIGDLADIIKHHDAVETTRLEVNAPGIAKTMWRETARKAVSK